MGRPREGSSFRLRFIIGKKNSLNGGRSGCFFQSAEMTLKRDSIKSKIFEEEREGFGEVFLLWEIKRGSGSLFAGAFIRCLAFQGRCGYGT